MANIKPFKQVTETLREQETFKYDPSFFINARVNNDGTPFPSSELSTSNDSVLTALAQLATWQTGTERALISLFDASHQYVIAEATPTMPLTPGLRGRDCGGETIVLCGTAIPRNHAACEYTLLGAHSTTTPAAQRPADLPLTLVPDVTVDPRFSSKPYCQVPSRFHAAVPIRTRRGINIGVICVLDSAPLGAWSERHASRLREISQTIMEHLESNRSMHERNLNDRMTRGLGSFIEGKCNISGSQSGPNTVAVTEAAQETSAAAHQPILNGRQDLSPYHADETASSLPSAPISLDMAPIKMNAAFSSLATPSPLPLVRETLTDVHIGGLQDAEDQAAYSSTPARIFSKAADAIRESLQTDGCFFLEAKLWSYSARLSRSAESNSERESQSSSISSNDERKPPPPDALGYPHCKVLGASTPNLSGVDDPEIASPRLSMAEAFLAKLLRRYPKGKIFNFDAQGELIYASESSEDEATPHSSRDFLAGDGPNGQQTAQNRPVKPWARQNEGCILLKAFPGARSVGFMPVWDPRRERWLAGSFIYTLAPSRVFTTDIELSYLKAFGSLSAAEILRFEDSKSDKAKSDTLGSLSHELRSPLHGVLLGTELLCDTDLSAFQKNVAHTIEICCRTLLETIDHLLDYSKVNSFSGRQKTLVENTARPTQFGKKKRYSSVRIDGLTEEVIESVFAGYNFQHMHANQLSKNDDGAENSDGVPHPGKVEPVLASEQLDSIFSYEDESKGSFGDVSIFIVIDPALSWTFHTHAGAIRRAIMNIFGNALKYTRTGTIRVLLTQEESPASHRTKRIVKLVVQDTGKGIGPEFLRYRLFKPFAQEDELAPGTGLGLSLVKQIVTRLRGKIFVDSQVGIGTTVTLTLPLEQSPPTPDGLLQPTEADEAFEGHLRGLEGLRVCLLGFRCEKKDSGLEGHGIIRDICRNWLSMEVIEETQISAPKPVLALISEDTLPDSFSPAESFTAVPTVVVCRNITTAYRLFTLYDTAGQITTFEFVSQPIGPRKLARAFSLVWKRWMSRDKLSQGARSMRLPVQRPVGVNRSLSFEDWQLSRKIPTQPLGKDNVTSTLQSVIPEYTHPADKRLSNAPPSIAANIILLVDDNDINLKIISTYMKKLGQNYSTAVNGKEAVDKYTQQPRQYSCILMDISMPIMDGFEATRQIRAHEHKTHIHPVPIFALTGLASDGAHREALDSGVDVFLTKPVRLKVLRSLLETRGILKQDSPS